MKNSHEIVAVFVFVLLYIYIRLIRISIKCSKKRQEREDPLLFFILKNVFSSDMPR